MKNMKNFEETAKKLAFMGLNLGVFKVKSGESVLCPPEVDSGNQVLLFHPVMRHLIITGFLQILTDLGLSKFDVIAGTATGIPYAYGVAEVLDLPLVYVTNVNNLSGKKILLIESFLVNDVSSVNAVNVIRKAGGICDYCLSIFSYEVSEPEKMFFKEILYDKENKTSESCNVVSLLSYSELLKIGIDNNLLSQENKKF